VTPATGRLRAVKLLHTAIWAVLAACILALPFLAWAGQYLPALIIIGLVTLEGMVLAMNRGSCPLTAVAGRYTEDRSANFDIYLPLWLARYNKQIFTTLFAIGVLVTLARFLGWA
jgi:hypothetical protein